jgi:hypothetical protein
MSTVSMRERLAWAPWMAQSSVFDRDGDPGSAPCPSLT